MFNSLHFHGLGARSVVAAMEATMSSAAARGPEGDYFAANVRKKETGHSAGATRAGLLVASRRGAAGCAGLRMKASGGSHMDVGVEKVNGRKVNGINRKESLHLEKGTIRVDESAAGGGRDVPSHAFKLGRFVENRFVYRQTFVIRSYEIGPDKTATMETLMNLLQETALNHVMSSGLAGDGFGATHEMSLRKLIWVVTRISIQVDKYSRWGDVVEIDTWVAAAGKNGMRRDWVIRDFSSQEIITRATSTWVIMNRETRRLSKIPEPVREELNPYYLDRRIIREGEVDAGKIDKLDDETAQRIRSGLEPRWNDMDANQHVNNVKYIGWILESVPMNVLEDYGLISMTLEYRQECRQSHLLESLTSMGTKLLPNRNSHGNAAVMLPAAAADHLRSIHLLRLQEGKAEVVRARAEWRRKGMQVIHLPG